MSEKFYGKYRGKVVNNLDPRRLGRLEVIVPGVMGPVPLPNWAMPCVPYAGQGVGFLAVPPQHANVWVEFEDGDLNHPIWVGCFWAQMEIMPEALAPTTKILKTDSTTLKIDDLLRAFEIEVTTPTGPIKLTMNAEGIQLNTSTADVHITAQQVEIKNGVAAVTVAPQEIKVQNGSGTVTVAPTGVTMNAGAASIQMTGASVNINNGALEVT